MFFTDTLQSVLEESAAWSAGFPGGEGSSSQLQEAGVLPARMRK